MTSQRDERPTDTTPSAPPSDGRGTRRVVAAVAPAVALLLWGDVALAFDGDDDDGVVAVPGPSSLILLAVGAGGAALAQRWRNRKK